MRKPVHAICEQQRLRSACASASVVRCLDSMIPLVLMSEISSLYLASAAEQAYLSLSWSQTPKTGFFVTWLNYVFCQQPETRKGTASRWFFTTMRLMGTQYYLTAHRYQMNASPYSTGPAVKDGKVSWCG